MTEGLVSRGQPARLDARALHQEAVAKLGLRALEVSDLGTLTAEAVRVVAETLGTDSAGILEALPDGATMKFLASWGWEDPPAEVAVAPGSQLEFTLRAAGPVVVVDLPTETRFDPAPELLRRGFVSALSVAIHHREGRFGLLGTHHRSARTFSTDDETFLQSAANVLGAAAARIQAEQRERQARAEAEVAQQRLALVAEVSTAAASSLDYRETLKAISRAGVALSDWCLVHLAGDDGEIWQVAVSHPDPEKERLALQIAEYYPLDPAATRGVPNVIRTGQAEVVQDVEASLPGAQGVEADHLRFLWSLQIRSSICVPLSARNTTVGAITFASTKPGRRYGPDDVALAQELARRAALAVDNDRLFRELQEAEGRVRALLQTLDAVVWEADPDTFSFCFVSQGAEDILGYPPEHWVADADFWKSLIHAEDLEEVRNWLADLRAQPGNGSDREIEYRAKSAQGQTVWLRNVAHLVAGGHGSGLLRGFMVNITKTKQGEARQSAEGAAARALAEASTLAEAAPGILEGICRSIGWAAGALWMTGEDGVLRCLETWNAPTLDLAGFWTQSRELELRAGEGLPGRVLDAGTSWLEDVTQDPGFARAAAASTSGLRSAVAFPVETGGQTVGVMEFFTESVREPDEDLLRMMSSIGGQIGQFHERAEAEKRAERALREDEERFAFLAGASTLLAGSLDVQATLDNVTRLAVPYLADWCVVDLLDRSGLRRMSLHHSRPGADALLEELDRLYPRQADAPFGAPNVVRTGVSELLEEIPKEMLTGIAKDARHLEILLSLGITSAMIVPLIARGRTLGAVTFASSTTGRRYGRSDLRLAEDLASRAALAVDNARLYDDKAQVARTLQQSLLPPETPRIPHLDVAARYHPAGEGLEVGGDFYDIFPVGRKTWALTIGDVCGKGAEAAALTALARYTVRTAAMFPREPHQILSLLNEAVRRQRTDDRYCTCVFAKIDPSPRGAKVTLSCGGHPPPYLVQRFGKVDKIRCQGTLLGLFPDVSLNDAHVELTPGDALVFYTDGVTEGRGKTVPFGEGMLKTVLTRTIGKDADATARELEKTVLDYQNGNASDDMAIVVIKAPLRS
ncbi:MAG TPA: GAF domain-containing protein [Actinomycetota bacterium]|nr:GAF domain-containing protein [Actinomycetota bacterium]